MLPFTLIEAPVAQVGILKFIANSVVRETVISNVTSLLYGYSFLSDEEIRGRPVSIAGLMGCINLT